METPVRMRQTRMHSGPWESPPGFKCQTRQGRPKDDLPVSSDGNTTPLRPRHVGPMHRAESAGHVAWLKRLWDRLTRPRQFSVAFLHFKGGRRR